MKRAAFLFLLSLAGCAGTSADHPVKGTAEWSAHPADGVRLELSDDEGALRLDFRFSAGGYAIARREVDLDLPANFAFRFRLRGEALPNDLEFKLIDDSGENVWWHVARDVEWPTEWETVRIKKRQIDFAWGPRGGGEMEHVAAIEFAVTAGSGGEGTIWIDDLELVELPLQKDPPPAPIASASSFAPGHAPALAVDGDPATSWRPAAGDEVPWLELDLGRAREFGALTLQWETRRGAADYTVIGTLDGATDSLRTVHGGNGGGDDLYLPETEADALRIATRPGAGLAEVTLQPLEFSATREAFFMNLAQRAERGLYPRGFLDEPTAWTVAGVDRDTREGLLGADGAIEAGPGEFSVEPFLQVGDRLRTWDDFQHEEFLNDGDLPLPYTICESDDWWISVGASGVGEPGASSLLGQFVVRNVGPRTAKATLWLAIRPFQVNPPVQFLNVRGGTAPIASIARSDRIVEVNGRPRVLLPDRPDAFAASTFDGGSIVERLAAGDLPASEAVADPFEAASAVIGYDLCLPPNHSRVVNVLLPLHDFVPDLGTCDPQAEYDAVRDRWREKVRRVSIEIPDSERDIFETAKAQVGWILVNRAGPAIQPGTRSYARSWIRDGTLTSVALLRMGQFEAARDFLLWYAPHQYENGKIPCVVDRRGADPVPEHDSTGEFIHLVCEYLRYTGDRDVAEQMWPRVVAGVDYLESLLEQRRTPEYEEESLREFYGILPPSISHEGYAAKPMHSYWDDFFALRGLKDAVRLADDLGHPSAELAALRDRFAGDLSASIAAAMQRHDIDYIPGCADLGDFDATSTTVALDPAAAGDLLPPGALERTFERYWEFFDGRLHGDPWRAFTPYEIRTIGSFVRLGWRERAHEALEFFLAHRIPAGWKQWPEVVASDTTKAWFVGDMPHTWVGSDYVRSVLDLFCYELRDDEALVLAAGVPIDWIQDRYVMGLRMPDTGVRVTDLPTPYGSLAYELTADAEQGVMVLGEGIEAPPGGLRIAAPLPATGALVDGKPAVLDPAGRILVDHVPARIVWRR